jgi:hypothetical protein
MEVEASLAQFSQPENTQPPFLGPIYDAGGDKRISTGDEMPDDELLRMCWYVEGVIAEDGSPAEVPGGCGGDY